MQIGGTRFRFKPSLGEALFIGSLLLVLNIGHRFISDGDIFWHLLTGEQILKTFQIPVQDAYSYTMAGTNWMAHEWGAEVVFALFYKAMRLNGVVILAVLVVTITLLMLYKFLIFRKVHPLLAVLLVIFAGTVSNVHWSGRPHIFSLPLTLLFFIILELYQREKQDYLKILPLLMLLWVNLHAGFMFGIILVLIYLGINFLYVLLATEEVAEKRKSLKKMAFISVATFAATLVNPRGFNILLFPFSLTGNSVIMNSIEEWMSPDFHRFRDAHFFLLFYIAGLILAKKKPDLIEVAIFLLLLYMSLYSVRYLAIFALLTTPIVAVRWQQILATAASEAAHISLVKRLLMRWEKVGEEAVALESPKRPLIWVYLSLCLLLAIGINDGKIAGFRLLNYRIDRAAFPVDAMRFVTTNQINGRMFNQDHWGGYILLQSYPEQKVFFDGRNDMYGGEFMKDYLHIAQMHTTYTNLLEKYDVTWVIYEANSPLCRALKASGKWQLVYADGVANVLLKDIPENVAIIQRYPHVRFLGKGEMPIDEEEEAELLRAGEGIFK